MYGHVHSSQAISSTCQGASVTYGETDNRVQQIKAGYRDYQRLGSVFFGQAKLRFEDGGSCSACCVNCAEVGMSICFLPTQRWDVVGCAVGCVLDGILVSLARLRCTSKTSLP